MLTTSNNTGGELLFLKPVGQNKDKVRVQPYFEVSKKNGEEYEVQPGTDLNVVVGDLFKVATREEEYKGDKYYRAQIFLRDGGEAYLLSTRLNISSRSLLNSLFNLETFEQVRIKFYRNKDGYETFFVEQNGEKVRWKYEGDAVPAAKEVEFKGKTIRDFTDVDNFYVEKIAELNERLGNQAKTEVLDEAAGKQLASTDTQPF